MPTFAYSSPALAVEALCQRITPVEVEHAPLFRAAGRVLAADALTDRPNPPADVSSMDGFAVRVIDLGKGKLSIAGEVAIGTPPPPLPSGEQGACIRAVTGGGIPAGADAIIKREDVREEQGQIVFDPALAASVRPGNYIRRRGENAPAGAAFLRAGDTLSPAAIGALAATGHSEVALRRELRIGIITTGDELVSLDESPSEWQIRDSNAATLFSLFTAFRWVGSISHLNCADDAGEMRNAVDELLAACDALFLAGGVSAGHRDFVAETLAAAGVERIFHGLPQRPGKPMFGGVTADGRPVLGLPGNPVSALVTARRIGLPALFARAGANDTNRVGTVTLANPDTQHIALWWHRPVRLLCGGAAELVPIQSSGDLLNVARADGFIEVPPNQLGPGPWPLYRWLE